MFRKSFLVKSVFVLSVLVVAMILVGGCGTATPEPTAIPPCDLQSSDRGPAFVQSTAISYVRSHYPEQNLPAEDYWKPSEGWTRTVNCLSGPCQVIVANRVTGFRWEGDVYWSGDINYKLCYYEGKVDRVEERSVTIPTPAKPATLITPPPTCAPNPCTRPKLPDVELVLSYMNQHYPEDSPREVQWQYVGGRSTSSGMFDVWKADEWTILIDSSNVPSLIIVTNDKTGFRLEGGLAYPPIQSGCFCRYETVITQVSVTRAKDRIGTPPAIPTVPTPTR